MIMKKISLNTGRKKEKKINDLKNLDLPKMIRKQKFITSKSNQKFRQQRKTLSLQIQKTFPKSTL